MLPVWLIALLIGGALVVAYWDEVVEWATKFFYAFKKWFAQNFPRLNHYVKVFIEKLKGDHATIKCNSYYQEGENWFTQEGVKQIPTSEVPADILAQAKSTQKKEDITVQVLGRTM